MYRDVALWRQVRHRMLDSGTSKRRISRETGMSRATIRKMAAYERPPGYGPRVTHYPKLGRTSIPSTVCLKSQSQPLVRAA
jgi:hypothetical protein